MSHNGARLGLVVAMACAAGAVAARVAPAIPPKSGATMCALTPADFQSAGIQNASKPTANVQDAGASVYCVYAGKSSATGGIELDVFYPAGSNPADVKATYDTAIGESSSGGLKPIDLTGADEARWSGRTVSGGPPFAEIAVRRSSLVFVLGVPANANAQAQLMKLARILLERF